MECFSWAYPLPVIKPLVERRTTLQDLPISFLTLIGLASLYAYFALRWEVPLERIGVVVAFAVVTHSAYDLAREFLERQRMHHEGTFRRQLRHLENQSPNEEALRSVCSKDWICCVRLCSHQGGFISVRRSEEFIVIATEDPLRPAQPLRQRL